LHFPIAPNLPNLQHHDIFDSLSPALYSSQQNYNSPTFSYIHLDTAQHNSFSVVQALLPASPRLKDITDGRRDVPKTYYLEKMMTEATGRRPLQRVYLWMPSRGRVSASGSVKGSVGKGATTEKYDPESDGPIAHSTYPVLLRIKSLSRTTRPSSIWRWVWLLATIPNSTRLRASRETKAGSWREKRGILRRDAGAMRIFIPVTDYIADQAKFYVGCRFADGRLYPRVIKDANIFFYPELWHDVDVNAPAKERKSELSKACKRWAANN
jgi:hypothetical protein